jgi:hypothetical protein
MAGRARLGKQFWRRLAGIEIFLRDHSRAAQQDGSGGEREQTARQFAGWQYHGRWHARLMQSQSVAAVAKAGLQRGR